MISQHDIEAMREPPLAKEIRQAEPVREASFDPLAVQQAWLQWTAYTLEGMGWRGTARALLKAGGFEVKE